MDHKIVSIESFEITGPYSLRLKFSDGKINLVDLSGMLHGELYGPLRDEKVFRSVKLDPEVKTLVWSNGADFDPATLYDWDLVLEELQNRSKSWITGE
jgi:hypothetical protein